MSKFVEFSRLRAWSAKDRTSPPVAGVLDESYSQLTPLSGVAVQARQSTYAGPEFGLHTVACLPTFVDIQFPHVLATPLLLESPDVVGVL